MATDFYKYSDSPTVYGQGNKAFSSAQDFFNAGGAKDFSNVQTIAGSAPKLLTNSAPTVIQPGQTTSTGPLNLPQPDNNTSLADASVAGAGQTAKTLQDYMAELAPPTTALDSQNSALMDRLSSLYGQNTGRANATLEAENTAGLPELKKQMAELNSQILTKNAEYDKLNTNLEGQAIPTGLIIGQQAQARRQQASDIGLLQARGLGLQGNIQAAQDAVERAVNLKYQGIEEEITAKEKQLQLIQPLLNQQQQKIAQAQERMYADQKEKIAEQKATLKTNINYAIDQNVAEPYFYRGNQLIKTATGQAEYENVGGEIRRLSDGKRYESSAQFFADSGISNWSQIHVNTAQPVKFETVTIGSGKNNIKVRYGYDEKGNVVSAINLNTGEPYSLNGSSSPVSSSSSTPKSAPAKKITLAQATNDADAFVQSVRGKDGFVSPEDWKRMKAAWIQDGQDVNSFYSRFKKYINLADPQDY